MRDLALTETGDLKIEAGDLVLITGLDLVRQQYREEVMTVLGEWKFDTTHGIDWFGQVLVKSPDIPALTVLFGSKLAGLPGVSNVIAVRGELEDRTLSIAHAFVFTDPATGEREESAIGAALGLDDGEFMLLLDPLGGV